METENLRQEMIALFKEYFSLPSDGKGNDWFIERLEAWEKYCIKRELYMKAKAEETGKFYKRIGFDLNN